MQTEAVSTCKITMFGTFPFSYIFYMELKDAKKKSYL